MIFGLWGSYIFLQNQNIFDGSRDMTRQSWHLRARFRGFVWKIHPKNWLFENFCSTFLGPRRSKSPYFWFLGEILWISSDVQSRIFKFLFSGHFNGHFLSILPEKSWKSGNFGLKMTKKTRKIKNLKIRLCTSLDNHKIYPETDLEPIWESQWLWKCYRVWF